MWPQQPSKPGIWSGVVSGKAAASVANGESLPQLPQRTTVSAVVKARDHVLPVLSENGFQRGDKVVLGRGTPCEETNEVLSVNPMVLVHPFQHSHRLGTEFAMAPRRRKKVSMIGSLDRSNSTSSFTSRSEARASPETMAERRRAQCEAARGGAPPSAANQSGSGGGRSGHRGEGGGGGKTKAKAKGGAEPMPVVEGTAAIE
jgi:hypothetical protein